jgi:glutamate/tyrosine decarboxylase-like PLP-dependent enzyme
VTNRDVHALLEQAAQYAGEYLSDIRTRRVFPDEAALAGLRIFDESLPREPCDPTEMLSLLHRYGSLATVAQTGGRYFGFVNGAAHPYALAARWLADAWDQNAALHVMSPIVSKLETICEGWLRELFELPRETVAGFVSGTSMSLICGLAAARDELLRRRNWNVAAQGLFGAPAIRVVLSTQTHGTVLKALSILGLGRERVELVPADDQGRMLAAKLPDLDHRTLIVVQAGNVNTGAFDPLAEICDRARKVGAWVHVDGAFGLWAGASRLKYPLYRGAEHADSWSVDAHKTLNVPYDCGIVLCRHRNALASALQATGSYISTSDHRDGMLFTPEMSRRARAVDLWATLKTLGRDGVERLVDQLCDRAVQMAQTLHAGGFRILNDVVFNQVLIACEESEQTNAVLARIQASGECWCSGTKWNDAPAIRVSVCSWATTPTDIERSAEVFAKALTAIKQHR